MTRGGSNDLNSNRVSHMQLMYTGIVLRNLLGWQFYYVAVVTKNTDCFTQFGKLL